MQKRKTKGGSIAELPGAIMLLLLGIMMPMIIMGSVFYKVYMFQSVVKDGTQLGANQTDYATAQTATTTFLTSHSPAGVSVSAPTINLVTKNVTYPTSSGNKTYATYYLQVQASGTVPPLLQMGSFFGAQIPGLTSAMPVQSTQAVYFENQQAAASAAGAAAAAS